MADLADKDASLTVKVVGASSTGAETNFIDATINGIKVDGSSVTQPVSIQNLPDTTGTDGTTAPANAVVVGGVTAAGVFQTFETNASGHLNIADGGGSITVDAASLPLPTGASTLAEQQSQTANQTNGNQTAVVRGQYNVSPPTLTSGSNGIVQLDSSGRLLVNVTTMPGVAVVSSVLPTGASTSALQTTANASLSSIDTKLTSPLTVNVNKITLTGIAPATANVTATSGTVVSSNLNRKGLIITNLTSTRVFLAFGSNPAVSNRGIMLANGGTFVMDAYTFTTEAIQAITTLGSSALSIQEFQ
jgi:hypothetical protein